MRIRRGSLIQMVTGMALIAACSGKLAVNDNRIDGGAVTRGTGGAGCFSGTEGTGGIATGGRIASSVTPTCPLDAKGFATVELSAICSGGVEWVNGSPYPCPTDSKALLTGLDCSEVTTDHTGFTRTIGCGFETIEYQSYEYRGAYDLQHDYAASYDLTTGSLSGLVIQEPAQFGPCMSYAYKAGTLPPDCPSAVTYRCTRIPENNANDAAYAGCRAPNDPGCATCCVTQTQADGCALWTGADSSTIYEVGNYLGHACPCGCRPCAQCSLEDERSIRLVVPHPECNCSLPQTGDPCASWCNRFLPYKSRTCPG